MRISDWSSDVCSSDLVALVNRLRRGNPALRDFTNLEFYNAWNDHVLVYGRRTRDLSSFVLIDVNLDPHNVQAAHFEVPLWEFGRTDEASIAVEDLLPGDRFTWRGKPTGSEPGRERVCQ